MVSESVDWILLPGAARSDGATSLALCVAPRLGVDDGDAARDLTLADFTRWVDWPSALAGLTFSVVLDGGEPIPATIVSAPSSALWAAAFGPHTPVRPFVHEHPELAPIATYDAMAIADDLLRGYSELALEPVEISTPWDETFWDPAVWTEPVGERAPGGVVDELWVNETWAHLRNIVGPEDEYQGLGWVGQSEDDYLTANADVFRSAADNEPWVPEWMLVTDPPQEWPHFVAVNDLQRIRSVEAVELAEREPADPQERARRIFDFHRVVAGLGHHPGLMRRLGLVIDLECDTRLLDRIGAGEGSTISIAIDGRPGAPEVTDQILRTAVVAHAGRLHVRPRGEAPVGLLAAGSRCRIEQFDYEGAGEAVVQLAGEEQRTQQGRASKAPTLRTTGLRLLQRDTKAELATLALTNSRAGLDNSGLVLYAEDVQRGARIDVHDETTSSWQSLHERRVSYRRPDEEATVSDEGFSQLTLTRRPAPAGEDPPQDAPIVVNDAIVAWDGWSLSAPRPGKVVNADPRSVSPEFCAENDTAVAIRVDSEPLPGSDIRVDTVVAPGSLPRLRFGRTYRMRMRTVDLAGGGLDRLEADAATAAPGVLDVAATAPVVFRRFEPVPPPDVTYAAPVPGPEDGIERPGETERRIVVRTGLDPRWDVFGPHPSISERLLVPPGCSVTMAEWHGRFDDAVGQGASAASRRSSYRLAGTESDVVVPGARSTGHLPDPASAGVTLWDVPGLPRGEVFGVLWPLDLEGMPQSLLLRVEGIEAGQSRAPDVDPIERVVTVFVPAAQRVAMKVASLVAEPDLMALPHIWQERLGAAAAEAMTQVTKGTHPHVSPSVVIEIVHAVPRPLTVPRAGMGVEIQDHHVEDSTSVSISWTWVVDAASTGTVRLLATWTRPRDDLGPPLSTSADGAARDIPNSEPTTVLVGGATPVPAPPDIAFPPESSEEQVYVGPVGGGPGVASVDLGFAGRVHLRVCVLATSRFTAFFPASFAVPDTEGMNALTLASEWVPIDVPNRGRPPAPDVAEILPLVVRRAELEPLIVEASSDVFPVAEEGMWVGDVWVEPVVEPAIRTDRYVREGGWLRVWFERPWFVTGEGEVPAIVAFEGRQPEAETDVAYPYGSLVAPDPGRGQSLSHPVTAAVFGREPDSWTRISSTELPATTDAASTLVLADRPIAFDQERQQWYTDLRVDLPLLYFPFVRLALVRDQPHSIAGPSGGMEVRISPVVTLDPIQVLPDRILTVAERVDGISLRLKGYQGRSFAAPSGQPVDGVPNTVSVSVEVKTTERDDLLSWRRLGWANTSTELLGGEHLQASCFLPFDESGPPGDYRVVVEELEELGWRNGGTSFRTVYVETVRMPRAVRPS